MKKNRTYQFLGTCCDLSSEDLAEMYDAAIAVKLSTIKKHCVLHNWERENGFSQDYPLSKETYICFYKSKFRSVPCYFITFSAIDSVWVKKEEL